MYSRVDQVAELLALILRRGLVVVMVGPISAQATTFRCVAIDLKALHPVRVQIDEGVDERILLGRCGGRVG